MPIEDVAILLGHSSPVITAKYYSHFVKARRDRHRRRSSHLLQCRPRVRRDRDPENEKVLSWIRELGNYSQSSPAEADQRPCDPAMVRRTLDVGSYTLRLQDSCWTEWLAVVEGQEWSVSDTFDLEFPNGRRLSRATPGPPFWTDGGQFRLRGKGEVTVTVRAGK